MAGNIYEMLREQLDEYSVGFPKTESSVEMKILRKLFTEDEAEMYLNLTMLLESPEDVAKRMNRPVEQVASVLERMFEKGLVFRLKRGESARYAAVPFVIGFYEFQVNRMDRELAQLFEQYFEEAFSKHTSSYTVPMRTIPVNKAISVSWPVAPYEDARQIIKQKDRIAVANCICRTQKGLINDGCDKPLEVCFSFGSHAEYYVERGMGRWISQEEALEILDKCEEAALVPQPYNAQNPGGMCNCCGDCCGILRALKKHPKPSQMVVTNYYAEVDEELCAACEICLERCQMEAIAVDDVAHVNRDRCIGCGLCVTTCTTGALSLVPKPVEQRREPPPSAKDTIMQLAKERGKNLIPLILSRREQ